MRECVRNLGTPVFPPRLFEAMLDEFGEDCRHPHRLEGRAPGRGLLQLLLQGHRSCPIGAAAPPRRASCRANELLYLRGDVPRLAERGCTRFDFGRSKLGTGPMRFKTNWGIEPSAAASMRSAPRAGAAPRDVNPLSPKIPAPGRGCGRSCRLRVANRLGPLHRPRPRLMARHPLPRPPHPVPARPRRQDPLVPRAQASRRPRRGSISPASPTTRPTRPTSPGFARRSARRSARRMSRSGARREVGGRRCGRWPRAGRSRSPCSTARRCAAFVADQLASGRIGTIFAFSGQMAQFVPAGCRARFVMDFGDVDFGQVRGLCGRGRR